MNALTKWLGSTVVAAMLTASAARADDVAAAEWQGVITAQVQAFRDRDAAAALNYAAASFHAAFSDPRDFYFAIITAGYGPIAESRSHSFGEYQMSGVDAVLQDVHFVGTDQSLYEAIYQMTKEPDGWRVAGVQLIKQKGIGV